VDEIRIVKEKVHLTESYAALAGALCSGSEQGSLPVVSSSLLYWLAGKNENGQWEEHIFL